MLAKHLSDPFYIKKKRVWYTGTDALEIGEGVCYDLDYTDSDNAATALSGLRVNAVARPSTTNNRVFAGVVIKAHDAESAGQMIEIALPGSRCQIKVADSAVTLGDGAVLNFLCGNSAGSWSAGGFLGRGAARSLQTISAAGLMLAELCEGEETGGIQIITAVAGALAAMISHGTVRIAGADIASDMTRTLADGTFLGQRLAVELSTLVTTSDFALTVTNGIQLDGSTALAAIAFDAVTERAILKWGGADWYVDYLVGATQS